MAKRTPRAEAGDTTTANTPARPSPPRGERPGRSRSPQETGSTDELPRPADAPNDEEIRYRAYEIYLERGGADGMDFDDWVRAEQELRRKR